MKHFITLFVFLVVTTTVSSEVHAEDYCMEVVVKMCNACSEGSFACQWVKHVARDSARAKRGGYVDLYITFQNSCYRMLDAGFDGNKIKDSTCRMANDVGKRYLDNRKREQKVLEERLEEERKKRQETEERIKKQLEENRRLREEKKKEDEKKSKKQTQRQQKRPPGSGEGP